MEHAKLWIWMRNEESGFQKCSLGWFKWSNNAISLISCTAQELL